MTHRLPSILPVALALAVLAAALVPLPSEAEMWCADPLWVHEWGVVVFGAGGAGRTTAGPSLPAFFHSSAPTKAGATGQPVRHLPVDGGERELPVLHFYAPRTWRPVPVGIEVGFSQGEATRWYPQVDGRRSAAEANGAEAQRGRAQLVAARQARGAGGQRQPLGRDPSRQLAWDALSLDASPATPPRATPEPWVQRLRGFNDALWVNGAGESERFVFYEGQTRETPAIAVERGPTYGPGRRHYLLRNTSAHAVHDVFLVHREGAASYVIAVASIPAGRTAGYVLEEHLVSAGELAARTRGALRAAIVDPHVPAPPADYRWGGANGCVMQRDPALPFERATGHQLYAHEADAILETWGARFFDAAGTTLVYREDAAQLDEAMPLSIYTDMYHFVEHRRLGLALVENVRLP